MSELNNKTKTNTKNVLSGAIMLYLLGFLVGLSVALEFPDTMPLWAKIVYLTIAGIIMCYAPIYYSDELKELKTESKTIEMGESNG